MARPPNLPAVLAIIGRSFGPTRAAVAPIMRKSSPYEMPNIMNRFRVLFIIQAYSVVKRESERRGF